MRKTFLKINFLNLLLWGFILMTPVDAGTLSCVTRPSACNAGEVEIFEMDSVSNSHVGLPSAAYSNLVCCSGIAGLSNDCSSSNSAVVLKLSDYTNAHARQNTLPNYPSNTNACLSVPNGGVVTVGYSTSDCKGYDTFLGSMNNITNSHVGSGKWLNGNIKICASVSGLGTLTTDIVNVSGQSVSAPAIDFSKLGFSFDSQTSVGVFGTPSEKIRIENSTDNPRWSLSIAASSPNAYWDGAPADYDFNDPCPGACDGPSVVDVDSLGGQMTINPSTAIITPKRGCSSVLSLGTANSFSQGKVDSITLLTAGSTSGTNCYWDITGINVSQTIPKEQPAADYNINLTLSIVAI